MAKIQLSSKCLHLNELRDGYRMNADYLSKLPRRSTGKGLGVTLVASLCMTPLTWAQLDAAPETAQSPEDIEQIVVTGERQKLQLRLQMNDAEKAAYDIFNKFNDEPRFDISCSFEEPTGSRIQSETQLCQPEFEIQAHRAQAGDMLESFRIWFDRYQTDKSSPVISQPAAAVIASQQNAYRAKLKEVAETQPEFLDALVKYSELKARYESTD